MIVTKHTLRAEKISSIHFQRSPQDTVNSMLLMATKYRQFNFTQAHKIPSIQCYINQKIPSIQYHTSQQVTVSTIQYYSNVKLSYHFIEFKTVYDQISYISIKEYEKTYI